jgi:hypothetical protein
MVTPCWLVEKRRREKKLDTGVGSVAGVKKRGSWLPVAAGWWWALRAGLAAVVAVCGAAAGVAAVVHDAEVGGVERLPTMHQRLDVIERW